MTAADWGYYERNPASDWTRVSDYVKYTSIAGDPWAANEPEKSCARYQPRNNKFWNKECDIAYDYLCEFVFG